MKWIVLLLLGCAAHARYPQAHLVSSEATDSTVVAPLQAEIAPPVKRHRSQGKTTDPREPIRWSYAKCVVQASTDSDFDTCRASANVKCRQAKLEPDCVR